MSYLREKPTKPSPHSNQKISQFFTLEIFRKTTEQNQNNFKSYTNKIYKKTKIGTFLTESIIKKYIKCSKKGCPYVIHLPTDVQSIQPIKCAASHQTCSTCFMPNHFPFACSLASIVSETSNSNAKSSLWMIANSKKCVQCGKYIEKIGGGNLMMCTCGREFCWLCLSNWNDHERLVCARLERELEIRQNNAKKVNENFKKIEIKFPNLEEKIHSFESDLNSFENSIKQHKNLSLDAEILCGIAGFIREAWTSVYYGINLSFLRTKIKKSQKIEDISCKIHDFLLPMMIFFKEIDKKSIKDLIRYLNEETTVQNLLELKEDLRILQEIFVDMKIPNKPNIRL